MESPSKRIKVAREEVIDRFLANVDVWQVIFEMLSVKDRIRLEMTNKRLSTLMFACWKGVTSFDAECVTKTSYTPSLRKNGKKQRASKGLAANRSVASFASICVSRIGDGLRSLTIREKFPIGSWDDSFRAVGEGCSNIETINFVFEHDHGTLDIRLDSFSRLKTLTVGSGALDLVCASSSLFLSIPASIEVIRGLCGGEAERTFENAAQMEGFFADRPSLREVYLNHLDTRDKSKADMFRVIAERCPHLKSITLSYYDNCIDYSGVTALESMKELRIPGALFNEKDIVTICERSLLVEVLELGLGFSSNIDLQSAALHALGALSMVRELSLYYVDGEVAAPSLATEFVRELARNSGASLRRLEIGGHMPLPTAAIEALANGCGKLRYVVFCVRVGETTPASIRFLIDSIVAHPSWIPQTDEPTLRIIVGVIRDHGDEAEAGFAALKPLAAPAPNLPAGVELEIG